MHATLWLGTVLNGRTRTSRSITGLRPEGAAASFQEEGDKAIMSNQRKTAIVTGASQGIGAGIVKAFVEKDFHVVANSRKMTQSTEVAASDRVALVDGHIGEPATAARIVETALSRFGSIDVLVNNAGIFFTKPFTDYTAEDFRSLVSTNVEGFLYVTQLAIQRMLAQQTGGSIVTITAALARNPVRGVPAAVPMITKGGLETVTQHLAMEYAREGIRVNAVAPGTVYTPLHRDTPEEVMEGLSPMGRPSTIQDIVSAVLYLTDAATVTGHILYVDGGAHFGHW
jgi:NAD(P)-dependent dehydrogenase (short-subunit alcohol dehydrogenase family)